MLLEYLTGQEFFEVELGKMQKILLAGDFGVEIQVLEEFIADAMEV